MSHRHGEQITPTHDEPSSYHVRGTCRVASTTGGERPSSDSTLSGDDPAPLPLVLFSSPPLVPCNTVITCSTSCSTSCRSLREAPVATSVLEYFCNSASACSDQSNFANKLSLRKMLCHFKMGKGHVGIPHEAKAGFICYALCLVRTWSPCSLFSRVTY